MWKRLAAALTACVFSFPLLAQKGTAPNGYYPSSYAGATFTGLLQSSSGDGQQITLLYAKGSKAAIFVGKLAATCSWKTKEGTVHTFDPSKTPSGTVLTAFYTSVTKNTEGRKSTENSVIAISLVEVGGKRMPENERAIIPCTTERFATFVAF